MHRTTRRRINPMNTKITRRTMLKGIGATLALPQGFDAAAALVLGTPAEAVPGRSRPRPALLWR